MQEQDKMALFLTFLEQRKGIVVDNSFLEEFSHWSGLEVASIRAWLFARNKLGHNKKEEEFFCGYGHA